MGDDADDDADADAGARTTTTGTFQARLFLQHQSIQARVAKLATCTLSKAAVQRRCSLLCSGAHVTISITLRLWSHFTWAVLDQKTWEAVFYPRDLSTRGTCNSLSHANFSRWL